MVVILQKAFREAAWAHCTLLRTFRLLFYLPVSLDLPTCFKCNWQTWLMSFILWYRGEKIIIIPWGWQWPRVTFPKWNLKVAEILSWSYFLLFGMFLRRPALVPEQQHSDLSCCQRRSLWAQSDLKTQFSKDVWSSAEQGREKVVVPPAEPWGCCQLWDNNSTFSCCQWSWKPIVLNRARSLPPQPQVEVSLVQREGWT